MARKRLDDDLAEGRHPAKNRTYSLYLTVKEQAEAIQVPHLVLDTGTAPFDVCVEHASNTCAGSRLDRVLHRGYRRCE